MKRYPLISYLKWLLIFSSIIGLSSCVTPMLKPSHLLDRLVHKLQGHQDSVMALAFTPDGKYLASGSLDNTIKLWQTQEGKLVKTFEGSKNWINTLAFTPDRIYFF